MTNTTQNIIKESIKRLKVKYNLDYKIEVGGDWIDNLNIKNFLDDVSSELQTAIKTAKEGVVEEIEKLQKVWEQTMLDSVKEKQSKEGIAIWRGGTMALGELLEIISTLKGNHEDL